jgi:YD repeat-containing protein
MSKHQFPTGYAQVIEEKDPFNTTQPLTKTHLYGHDLISSEISDLLSSVSKSSVFYSYDGLGSVRSLTNETGELQETYDYDAYGTLIGHAKRNETSGILESSLLTDHSARSLSPNSSTPENNGIRIWGHCRPTD